MLNDHEVLSPELKLMATEKRLRAMAEDVRRQRIIAAGFGVGLTAVGSVLYALNSPSTRGLPILVNPCLRCRSHPASRPLTFGSRTHVG